MDNEVIAMALRMIGKNIMLIADAIYKESEPAAVEEAEDKPKKRTRKTTKAKKEEEAPVEVHEAEPVETEPTETHEAEPVPEDEKPKEIKFTQVRAAAAQKSKYGYTDAVRNLIESYGVEKLSQIKKEDYAEFLKELEMIGYE